MIDARITADLMRTQSAAQAAVLAEASRQHAGAGRAVEAIAAAWAAEVLRLQATLASLVLVDRRAPNYRYFEAAEATVGALDLPWKEAASAADAIRAGRDALARGVEPVVFSQLSDGFVDLDYLDLLPGLDEASVTAFTRSRLQGRTPDQLVQARRKDAAEAMLRAQSQRMQADPAAAIRSAYEGDFRSLEAYLVQSAVAAGDGHLLTVSIRWDLAAYAMAELSGLPEAFEPAVTAIRQAIAAALGEPDGSRLMATFIQL